MMIDDPALMRKNVQIMESYALPISRAGHIPIIGEWLALPLVDLADSKEVGDQAFNEIFHPSRFACSRSATQACESGDRRPEQTKW